MASASNNLLDLGLQTVRELETEQGILASAQSELYGCIFGRDSLITSLKLLQVYKKTKNEDCLRIVKKSLKTLSELQGKEVNIESGEEPGKVIHEYRPTDYEHLTKGLPNPWYVYPDKIMRNFDTVDATPLFLIAAYRYFQVSQDSDFLAQILPNVDMALHWILNYGDGNGDGFIDYTVNPQRKSGGLINQSWMDSDVSAFHEDGAVVKYPLAPVEAQAYVYYALRLWATYYKGKNDEKAQELNEKAQALKKNFNESYLIFNDKRNVYLASAIDGNGKPLTSVRSSMGHALWASLSTLDDEQLDGIIEAKYVDKIVKRLLARDMFEPKAGIRTLSVLSRNFQPNSYHNGSIWPHDNSMIAEGLEHYGFKKEADQARKAYLKAIAHFNTPIELYVYWGGKYSEYTELSGRTGSKQQAWSAASVLADALSLQAKSQTIFDKLFGASVLLMLFNEVKMDRFHGIVGKSIAKFTNSVPVKKLPFPRRRTTTVASPISSS